MSSTPELRIVAFMCWKWGYGAGDMAGTIRGQYPTIIRPVRVTCTGRVSVDMVMRALGKGADGVAIVGWYPDECNYSTGSKHSIRNIDYLKSVLKSVGLEPERVQMHFCSAAEGQKFQSTMIIMAKEISDLGPSPLKQLAIEPKKKTTASKQTL